MSVRARKRPPPVSVPCGSLGWRTVHGGPCRQHVTPGASGCLWHSRTPAERSALARAAGYASTLKRTAVLPADTPRPVLDSPDSVRAELESTIHDVRTGRLDARLAAVVVSAIVAALRLAELQVAAQIGALEERLRLRRA